MSDTVTVKVTDSVGSTATATFVIPPAVLATTPIFSPVAGAYPTSQSVSISSNPGASILYTTDGSTPGAVGNPILTQPSFTGIAGHLWVHGGVPGGNPPNGTLGLISEQSNPVTSNGAFQVNAWNAGAKTGFTPNNPATAQLGYAATGTTTTAQAEGTTVGAYLQSIDRPTDPANSKMMVTPQIGFANQIIWGSSSIVLNGSMNLQIPTATGSDVFLNVNHQFIHSSGAGFTLNVDVFHHNQAAPSNIIPTQDVGATNTYIVNLPIGFAVSNPFMTTVAGAYTPNPWTGFLPFSWSISYAQFAAALQLAQTKFPSIPSVIPSDWTMTEMHVNAEYHFTPVTADCTLGWSMNNWDVTLGGTTTSVYTGPITVSASETLKALANVSGYAQSAIGTAAYVIGATVATPTLSPAAGNYTTSQTVSISCATSGATIHFTTDGSTPTTSSPVYSGPITVAVSVTVKAIATFPGFTQSAVASASYVIGALAVTPAFSPVAGTYASAQTVTISCSTPSSTIHFTTDGSTPTTASPVYSGPITVSASEAVQAIATASGFLQSNVGSAAYVINSGATQIFSFPNFSGSTSSLFLSPGNTAVSGAAMKLIISGNGHHGAQLWYRTQQPPGPFTTTFQFQFQGINPITTGISAQSGFSFVMQNIAFSPPGQASELGFVAGGDANMCGYGCAQLSFDQFPPQDALAIKFDSGSVMQMFPTGGLPSSTGMYLNQGTIVQPGKSLSQVPSLDLNPYGINFYSQNVTNCTIVYDGSFLTMVLVDTVTGAQARQVWPLNLAATTNSIGNTIGFSCGTAAQGFFLINNWAYFSGFNTRLAAPTFNLASGQYSGTQSVTLSGPSGASIYYTVNGLLPTSASTLYTGAITVAANTYIQAVAIQAGFTDSNVAAASYQINTSNVISFPGGFASGNLILCGFAYLSGSTIRLTDTTQSTGGAAWMSAPVNVTSFSTSFTVSYSAQGQGIAFVLQNTPAAIAPLTGVQITGTSGQISFNPTTIKVGHYVTISGAFGGTGSISGYSNQEIYSVGATNGTTTATLTTAIGWTDGPNPGNQIGGAALTTTAGTPTGLTFSHNAASFTGGPTVVGSSQNAIGYGGMDASNNTNSNQKAPGILNSIAIVLNQQNFAFQSDPPYGVGLYVNGANPYGSQISTGLTFATGTWNVTLTYSGTTLTVTMQSTGGGTTFTHSFTGVDIPSIVGGSTAIAGFTGGTFGANSIAAITKWTGF